MTSHNYIFFSLNPSFYALPSSVQKKSKQQFLKALQQEKEVVIYTYATLGLKANTAIMLWLQAETFDAIQVYINTLMHTKLGEHLSITQTLLGMARPTQYSPLATGYMKTQRKGGRYLVIYPFTKTKEWHLLAFEKRRSLMGGHVMIGKKYPQIEQVLLYSYGIDDSEFIVSYEMDDLLAFQSLVMELRTDAVRAYTQKDTPIYTCIYKTPEEVVRFL